MLEEETEKKHIYFRQSYYEMGPRSTKLLAKRLRKQQAFNTIYKIKDPCTEAVTQIPELENILKLFLRNFTHNRPQQVMRRGTFFNCCTSHQLEPIKKRKQWFSSRMVQSIQERMDNNSLQVLKLDPKRK